jgi:hypothetical protein
VSPKPTPRRRLDAATPSCSAFSSSFSSRPSFVEGALTTSAASPLHSVLANLDAKLNDGPLGAQHHCGFEFEGEFCPYSKSKQDVTSHQRHHYDPVSKKPRKIPFWFVSFPPLSFKGVSLTSSSISRFPLPPYSTLGGAGLEPYSKKVMGKGGLAQHLEKNIPRAHWNLKKPHVVDVIRARTTTM